MRLINILLACWLLIASGLALAIQDIELRNVEDEPRFNELSNVLRCMVCQNQSIADSNAELARDFRNQVKEKINAGQSNDEIVDYMVQRYGDYILYKPPFNVATALLWFGRQCLDHLVDRRHFLPRLLCHILPGYLLLRWLGLAGGNLTVQGNTCQW